MQPNYDKPPHTEPRCIARTENFNWPQRRTKISWNSALYLFEVAVKT